MATPVLAAVAALTATLALIARAAQPVEIASDADLGTWRVARLLYYNEYAEIGEGLTRIQAQNRLGKALVITNNGIDKLGAKPCALHRVVGIKPRTDLFISEKLPQNPNLGLPEKVTVFDYGCIGLWLRTDGNMVTAIDNYYFELRRVAQPAPRKRTAASAKLSGLRRPARIARSMSSTTPQPVRPSVFASAATLPHRPLSFPARQALSPRPAAHATPCSSSLLVFGSL